MSSKIDKWRRWLGEIKQQVYSVMQSRHVYNETVAIIHANKSLPKTSVFYGQLQVWYADSVIMAIRRQAKIDRQAISLARLMDEMRENPELISREYWTDLCKGYVVEEFSDRMFDHLAGRGAKHVDPTVVEADLVRFRNSLRSCERWADKRVAHFDAGKAPKPPTFGELDEALESLDEMLKKYFNLVTADAIAFTTPEIQYNWKRIFEHPWMPPVGDRAASRLSEG